AASLSFSILLLTSPRALGPPPFPYTTLFRSRGGTTGRLPTPRLWHGGWVWLGPGHPRPRQVPNPRCRATVPERSGPPWSVRVLRSEEHTSELQSRFDLVCRLLLEKKKHVVES